MKNKLLSIVLSCFISIGSLGLSAESAQPLPKTSEEISRYLEEIQSHTNEKIDQIIATAQEEDISGKMLRPWNQLSNEITSCFRVLAYLSGKEGETQEEAVKSIEKFKMFLYHSVLKNKELYNSLMTYIQKSFQKYETLSPYEREGVYRLLDTFKGVGLQEKVIALKSFFSSKERKPFIYLESPQIPSHFSKEQNLLVLSLNTCFIPDAFPYLYGGATLPWQERVVPMAKQIKKTKADVVCLQEVFSEDAFYALYEELKGEYKYFYGLIGPRFLGLSFQSVGMPSGLFVASKYPIENPEFTLFEDRGFPMNQGFFDFVVRKDSEIGAHVYATHLQSLEDKKFVEIRSLQMEQIIEKMQSDLASSKEEIPFFLCGDLNVPLGSIEPTTSLLNSHFYDNYNQVFDGVINEKNSTCTDYFTNYLLSEDKIPQKIDPKFQILDYSLLWKPQAETFTLKTHRVSMNDLRKPGEAISDHHGLLSSLEKVSKK